MGDFGLFAPCSSLGHCMVLRHLFWAQFSLLKLGLRRCLVFGRVGSHVAHAGVVLSLLTGPEGCDPGLCVLRFAFRMLRRHLACRSQEVWWDLPDAGLG